MNDTEKPSSCGPKPEVRDQRAGFKCTPVVGKKPHNEVDDIQIDVSSILREGCIQTKIGLVHTNFDALKSLLEALVIGISG